MAHSPGDFEHAATLRVLRDDVCCSSLRKANVKYSPQNWKLPLGDSGSHHLMSVVKRAHRFTEPALGLTQM